MKFQIHFSIVYVYVYIYIYSLICPVVAAMGVRRRQQKLTRNGHIKVIVKCLAKKLRSDTEQARMVSTDRVLPLGSLRRSCVRDLFSGWIVRLVGQGRVLTKKLSQQVLIQLRRKFGLPIGNMDEHKDEILRVSCKPAMSLVDNLETQPMDDELHSGFAQEFPVGPFPFFIYQCVFANFISS